MIAIVGTLAASCSIVSFLPQAVKIWRERDASAVSLRMYVITVTAFMLWTAYGALLKSWPLVVANLASLAISMTILLLKLRWTRAAARKG